MSTFSSQWFQGVCVSVHVVAAIVLLVATVDETVFGSSGHFQLYIQSTDPQNMMPEKFYVVSLFGMLSAFSFVTAGFHTYYFLNSNSNGDYSYDGALRYIEYSITASIMIVVIAILTGVVDFYTLLSIFFLSVSTMMFGYIEEKMVSIRDYPFWLRPFFLGFGPYVAAWAILITHFARLSTVPWFVYVIFFGEIVLFSSFAVVQYVYVVKPGEIKDQKTANGLYNVLSLTSKSLLVWFAFGGVVSMTVGGK